MDAGRKGVTDQEMISTMKDRLALQREVIGRLHYKMETLNKEKSELASENKWLKGEET
tara:strand:+ start:333 stop:506 length:174 start_codon:yes stop_codon:yes gene_type:complete